MTACDVLVAGGGSAGLAAAVAAGRAGARVILVERGGQLGGMATQALVHTICGLYEMREEPEPRLANEGFPPELARRLGGTPVRMGRLDVLPHDPVRFAGLCDTFALETPGLTTWLHAELCHAEGNASRLEEIGIVCRGQRERVRARAFIDATGDASLTALAGAAFAQVAPEQLQRPAYVAGLRGTAPGWLEEEGRLQLAHRVAAAVKAGTLPAAALGAGFRPGIAPDETFLTLDLAGEHDGPWNPVCPESLGAIEMEGRRTALALADFLGCRVGMFPARAGVRESRRACGVHEISADEYLAGAQFADAIAQSAWPMELRERPTGPRWRFPERPAGIPLRALRHRDVENLWVAGRCLSAAHEAQSGLRVIGTCLATGEAVGLAALEPFPESGWEGLAARVIRSRRELPRPC